MATLSRSETVFAVVLASVLGIGLTLAYQSHQLTTQNRVASRADIRATETEQRISVHCVGPDEASRSLCAEDIRNAAEDAARSERDLAAQELMAQWALSTALTGLAGLLVTIVGIFYVRKTLEQSISATKAAYDAIAVTEKMGRLQTQAYLSFSGTDPLFVVSEGSPVSLTVRAKFRNTGQSPGSIVYGFCQVYFLTDLNVAFHYREQRYNQYRMKLIIGPGEERWIYTPNIPIEQISGAIGDGRMLVIVGYIEFTDVFDETARVQDFCVGLAFHSDPTKLDDGKLPTHDWIAHPNYSVKIA